ncbi:MAG: hypothetical protein ACRDPA_12370, partial [Solirubrobacteraceae bacterium]
MVAGVVFADGVGAGWAPYVEGATASGRDAAMVCGEPTVTFDAGALGAAAVAGVLEAAPVPRDCALGAGAVSPVTGWEA